MRVLDERFDADGEFVFGQRKFVLAAGMLFDLFLHAVEAAGRRRKIRPQRRRRARSAWPGRRLRAAAILLGKLTPASPAVSATVFWASAMRACDGLDFAGEPLEFHLRLVHRLRGRWPARATCRCAAPAPGPWRRGRGGGFGEFADFVLPHDELRAQFMHDRFDFLLLLLDAGGLGFALRLPLPRRRRSGGRCCRFRRRSAGLRWWCAAAASWPAAAGR